MPVVLMGHEDGQVTKAVIPGSEDEGWTDQQRFLAITHDDGANRGIWVHHKEQSGSVKPIWIESDDPEFARQIADHYGCPVGRPDQGSEG